MPVMAALVAAFLLASCATSGGQKGPSAVPIPDSFRSLAMTITQRDSMIRTVKASARIKLKRDGQKQESAGIEMEMQRPGKMRVEMLGPFFETEGLLVMDGTRFLSLYMSDKVARTGVLNSGTMEDESGIPMDPMELESILVGSVPLIEYTQGSMGVDDKTGNIVLMIEKPGSLGQEIRVDQATLAINSFRQYETGSDIPGGKTVYSVEYLETSLLSGMPFPRIIKVDFIGWGEMEFKYKDLELNVEIPESDFDTDPPPGFTIR